MNKQEQRDKKNEHRHAIVEHPQYIYRMRAFRHDLGQREKSQGKKKMSIATQSLNIRGTYIECVRFDMIWAAGKKS